MSCRTASRRSSTLRAAAAGFAVAAFLALLGGCASQPGPKRSKTELAFDTVCTISLYDRAPRGTLDRAFALLRRIGEKTTIDLASGELIGVNGGAGRKAEKVDGALFHLVEVGLHYSRLTHGTFDITVGPLTKLWGIGTGGNRVPPEAEIRRVLELVDYHDVVLNSAEQTVYLTRPGMAIDLGAIAKGYAGDRVKELLEQAGVRHAIIDLGGNVVTIGGRPDGSPWRVGIQDPEAPRGSYVGILSVTGESVVSSGQYERFFTYEGKRYGHILSTRSGFPVDNGVTSVTIVSASSTDADALSTAVFALGVNRGLELVDSLPGVAAVILASDKRVYLSSRITASFRLTDSSYAIAPRIAVPAG